MCYNGAWLYAERFVASTHESFSARPLAKGGELEFFGPCELQHSHLIQPPNEGNAMDECSPEVAPMRGFSAGYTELYCWSLEKLPLSSQVFLAGLSVLLSALFWILFMVVGDDMRSTFEIDIGPGQLTAGLVGAAAVLAIHELFHGVAMRAFGAHPRYGMARNKIMLVLYATAPGYAFKRNQYLTVCLAPLIGISALMLVGLLYLKGTAWVWLFAFCGAMNGGGAIGDLWFFFKILRYPSRSYVVDERDGFRILLPSPSSQPFLG